MSFIDPKRRVWMREKKCYFYNILTTEEKKKKRLSIYLSSKGRHGAGDVEFLIVQSIKEPPGVGNTTPPQIILSIGHGVWCKHKPWRIHRNLWVISTHQLTLHSLCQADCPQALSFKGPGNLRSNNDNSFHICRSQKGLAGL